MRRRTRPADGAAPLRPLAAAVLLSLLLPAAVVRAQSSLTGDFSDRWVRPTDALTLHIGQDLNARGNDLRIFAGAADVTALVRFPQPGVLLIDPRAAPLQSGEAELVVWLVDGAEWREVGRLPLKVLSAAGLEAGSLTPKLDLAAKSRFEQRTRGDATAPPRPTFADLTGRAAASFEARRGAIAADGNFNASGSSFRGEALRFGQLGAGAPKVDLNDYLVTGRVRASSLAVGHLSTGNNPLLLNGFASRGLGFTQTIGSRLDIRLNALNGTSIVGYDNFFGLEESDHRVYAATAGYEFIAERPGALRAELTYLKASVQSRNNFNVGEIPDAEESDGIGLRVSGSTEGGRVRGDLVLARSTYVNPFDPQLAQGGELQAVRPATASGRIVDLSIDLLQGSTALAEKHPLTVTLGLHHERVEPLYRSLGAFFSADQEQNRVTLAAQMAGAQLQLLGSRQEDNVDDVPTVLKNRTSTSSATLALPLPQWLGTADGRSWWPATNYAYQAVAQRAINEPATADSGFAATHRPDQKNRSHQLNLSWNLMPWALSYGAIYAVQDNRQVGRENADFTNNGHQVSLSVRASDTLNLSLGFNRARNYSRERDLATYTNGGNGGIDWQFAQRWSITANIGRTLGSDSRNFTASANDNVQAQLTYRYEIASFGRKLPGQAFVRYVRQANESRDASFGLATDGSQWAWDAGISLSLF
jgi:hypothetical protein